MLTKPEVTLSVAECRHLLTLIRQNEQSGCYTGDKRVYWAISESVKVKLEKIKANKK